MTDSGGSPRIRVAAVIVRNASILLVRHEKDGKSYWLLPGGGVEMGETLPEALKREVCEETKLEIQVRNLLYLNESVSPNGQRHIVHVCFWADSGDAEPVRGDDPRVVEARFVSLDEFEGLTFLPDIRLNLLQAIRNKALTGGEYVQTLWREL